jgi:hypothetical protein
MECHGHITILAPHRLPATRAGGVIGKTTAVKEKEDLFTTIQGLGNGFLEFFGHERLGIAAPLCLPKIDDLDIRQALIFDPLPEIKPFELLCLHIVI